jgi:hypothetical protein
MRRESDTLRTGDRAPEFTLFDANGRAHSFSELLPGARTEVRAYEEGRTFEERRAYEEASVYEEGSRPLQPNRLLLVFDRGTW